MVVHHTVAAHRCIRHLPHHAKPHPKEEKQRAGRTSTEKQNLDARAKSAASDDESTLCL